MQLATSTESWGSGNQTWLGSAHGTDVARTVTIDGTTISAYDGVVPSGTPLKRNADGKYAPVAEVTDELAGFLFTNQSFTGDVDVIAPMIWHGRIRADRLPETAFAVDTLETANPQITIEKEA